jgi:hypothetical protein
LSVWRLTASALQVNRRSDRVSSVPLYLGHHECLHATIGW